MPEMIFISNVVTELIRGHSIVSVKHWLGFVFQRYISDPTFHNSYLAWEFWRKSLYQRVFPSVVDFLKMLGWVAINSILISGVYQTWKETWRAWHGKPGYEKYCRKTSDCRRGLAKDWVIWRCFTIILSRYFTVILKRCLTVILMIDKLEFSFYEVLSNLIFHRL